ncbi:MAG: BamA/TamA family outer membrane protein [Vicinamibacterales bacterium]
MPARPSRRRPVLAIAILAAIISSTPASAQYFGRNKVQYRSFDFQVLKTELFDIYYYPEGREGVDLAARMAERWNARLERVFDYKLRGRQPLILYASHVDFEQTNVISGELGEGTGGVTESVRRRIILPLAGPLADTDHVIGHELVHAFQYDIAMPPDRRGGMSGLERLPLWFIEGMAEYLTIGPVDPNTAMWMRDAVRQEKFPTIRDLNNTRYFPYRWGQAFWAYVAGRWGDSVVATMLSSAAASGSVTAAIEAVLGTNEKDLSAEWHRAMRDHYAPVLDAATPPDRAGRVIVKGQELGGALNVGPSLSPDGRWMTYLSDRDFLSVDLYLAEAGTGRVVRRLTSTGTDPHYSSLQFIYSSGGWDRESRRIAVATVTGGRPALAIFDASSGRREREVRIPDVDELFNPTWAPDGRAIAFTGMKQGLTDLFVYDLEAGSLRRLTNDAFAELQPAWSPDGRRIAFATDRFTTNLDTLATGAWRLAIANASSGAVEPVRAFETGKHINPQWSPDGTALYFIGDPDGVSNVYRVEIGTGALAQVTRVGTGVSGITAASPALSVAAGTGDMAFTVYDTGRYDIYGREASAPAGAVAPLPAGAAQLPPAERKASDVTAVLADTAAGAVDASTFKTEPYKATLQLSGVGQPTVGVGVSQFGTSLGGALSLIFSDMLENHLLGTAVQVNSGLTGEFSVKDIGAEVAYLDREHRWNWGATGGQFPYLSGGYQYVVQRAPNGDLIETDQLYIYRQTERSASGVVAYPFDRARRVEFTGGIGHISFEQIVRTTSYSLLTGQLYEDATETTSLGDPLTLGTSSAAFVFDTSTFGATSPIQGQRYRLEASPAFGTITFTNLLADYRRYFMPAPFYTFAVRGLHYGRYGKGGEDARLYPLYIGYPSLVRGYDVTSFDSSDCVPDATSDCPAIDRLLGSRLMVGSAEVRFPLLRPFGLSRGMYGPIPVEVALFADAGVAWSRGQKPDLFGGAREGVASAGVAFRVNLLGFAVAEFDIVKPFQRRNQGWMFAFNLLPGW